MSRFYFCNVGPIFIFIHVHTRNSIRPAYSTFSSVALTHTMTSITTDQTHHRHCDIILTGKLLLSFIYSFPYDYLLTYLPTYLPTYLLVLSEMCSQTTTMTCSIIYYFVYYILLLCKILCQFQSCLSPSPSSAYTYIPDT